MHPWTDRLSDYLDGALEGAERASLEAHLEGCVECRDTLAGLRAVVAQAARLEGMAPADDLWPGIAARLEPRAPRVLDLGAERERRSARRFAFTLPQLAAAAFALMLLSSGVVWMTLRARPGASPAGSGAASSVAVRRGAGPETIVASYDHARYDAAISELQQVLVAHRAELDTSTVRVIEQNLRLIDQATEQARRALAADPANPYLNDHLAEQLRRKVDLLQRASALVSAHG